MTDDNIETGTANAGAGTTNEAAAGAVEGTIKADATAGVDAVGQKADAALDTVKPDVTGDAKAAESKITTDVDTAKTDATADLAV